MRVTSPVPAPHSNIPLLDYLAGRFTYLSRAEWARLIDASLVLVNGVPCQQQTPVSQGDVIISELPPPPVDVNLDYRILYVDQWLLAVNKPANLRVHSGGLFSAANLIYHLRRKHQPPYPEARLVNRLDADTSGVVVVARDHESERHLSRQFAEGAVEKLYLAVVHGCPVPASGIISLPIGRATGSELPHRQSVADNTLDLFARYPPANSKEAVTYYKVERSLGERYSLLQLRPASGRTHQIRVHLAASGHPIAGDALYQMDDAAYLEWIRTDPRQALDGIGRQALHCMETAVAHPDDGRRLRLRAPLPGDISALIQKLETST